MILSKYFFYSIYNIGIVRIDNVLNGFFRRFVIAWFYLSVYGG